MWEAISKRCGILPHVCTPSESSRDRLPLLVPILPGSKHAWAHGQVTLVSPSAVKVKCFFIHFFISFFLVSPLCVPYKHTNRLSSLGIAACISPQDIWVNYICKSISQIKSLLQVLGWSCVDIFVSFPFSSLQYYFELFTVTPLYSVCLWT